MNWFQRSVVRALGAAYAAWQWVRSKLPKRSKRSLEREFARKLQKAMQAVVDDVKKAKAEDKDRIIRDPTFVIRCSPEGTVVTNAPATLGADIEVYDSPYKPIITLRRPCGAIHRDEATMPSANQREAMIVREPHNQDRPNVSDPVRDPTLPADSGDQSPSGD